MQKIIPLLLFICTFIFSGFAQTPIFKTPYPNGEVKALAAYGDTVIVGGQFSEIYTYAGSGNRMGVYDTLTKSFLPASINVQNGIIKKVIPDGTNTGYYVAGSFTVIGDSARKGIAHIDTTGKVTSKFSRFNPLAETKFNDLYLRGDTLLAAGKTLNICDSCQQYKNFTSINTGTGQLRSLVQSIDGEVQAITADGTGGWYLGGSFTVINGVQRYHAARIDSVGNVLPWNPMVKGYTVYSIYKDSGSVFIGGQFDMVGGEIRNALAEVDTFSGIVTSYNPKIVGYTVRKITRWSNKLIVGGSFNSVGDSARQNLVLIDLATHKPTALKLNVNADAYALTLSGNTLYLGGNFYSVNGVARQNLASVDLSTGTLNPLTLNVAGLLATSFTIYDMVLYSGQLYISGQAFPTNSSFTVAAGVVGIDPNSGAILQQYSVPVNDLVKSLALSGTTLYAIGNFTAFNALNRRKIAAINLSNNTVTAFNPLAVITPSLYLNSGSPYLGVERNGSLFIAHDPLTTGISLFNNGYTGTGLLGFHTTSDSIFKINHQLNGEVNAMTVFNDTLYIGGDFTLYARNRPTDSVRVNFAGISLNTLNPTNAYVYANGPVNALVMYGSTVIAGGGFSPQGLVGYEIPTQTQLTYPRSFYGNIKSMALHNGTLYLAGVFSTGVGLVASSPLWSGDHITWNNASVECQSVAAYNNKLYVCGTWSASGPIQMRTYNLPTRTLDQTINILQGSITTFCSAGRYMKMWGSFLSLGGILPANNLFAYSKSTGKIIFSNLGVYNQANPAAAAVNDLLVSGNTLYIGGDFDLINGKTRKSLASVNLIADTVTAWNPAVNGSVLSLDVMGNDLYAAGYFDLVGVSARKSVCSFNLSTGALSSWNPSVDRSGFSIPYIRQIKATSDRVYIAGEFSSVNGTPVASLAAFNRTSGNLLSWNPSVTNEHFKLRVTSVAGIALMGSDVYVLCDIRYTGNREVWALNTISGSVKEGWRNPQVLNNTMTLVPYRNGLLIPGVDNEGMIHMDTVSGNIRKVKLSSAGLTKNVSSTTFVNEILIDNNERVIYGGNFALALMDYYSAGGTFYLSKYLAETGISISKHTLTVSSKGLCFNRPGEIKITGFDSTDHQTYIVQLVSSYDQYATPIILGSINLPANPSCSFMFPNSYGEKYGLRLKLADFPSGEPGLEVPSLMNVGPNPPPPILIVTGSASVCEEKTVTLRGPNFPLSMYSYMWTRNDTLLPDAAQYSINTSKSGIYRIFLINSNGCYDSSGTKTATVAGHCAPPSGLRFKNVSTRTATLQWNKGSGNKSIVIARANVAVTAIPQNGSTYNAATAFGAGDDMGDMQYVVYNGNGNTVTVTTLDSLRTYFFTVIEYDDSATASSYIVPNSLSGQVTTPGRTYYAKNTGVLNLLSTWGTNPDGSGTAPANFTLPALYKITRNPASTLSADWVLANNGSYIEITDSNGGLPNKTVTIPAGMQIKAYGMEIKGRNNLTVTGNLNLNTVHAVDSSVVIFNGTAGQFIPPYSYARLLVSNATKTAGGPLTITDSLNMASVIVSAIDTITLGTSGSLSGGALVRTDGYIQGPFRRWIRNSVPTMNRGLMPVGANGKYQPVQLDLITIPAAYTNNINVVSHFIAGAPGTDGLPLTDQGITVNAMTTAGIWRVLKQDTISGLVYNLSATANNLFSVNDYTTTRLLFRNAGSGWQRFRDTTIIAGNNLSFTLTKDSVSLFGEFGIGSDTVVNPLPVKMLTFTGQLQRDKTVRLFWQTASENNNDFFTIQRSTDGINFASIGKIAGRGTLNTATSYRYDDQTSALVKIDRLYYRLMQIDYNGDFTYSKTITVVLPSGNETISLTPNPANELINVKGLLGDAVIRDIFGTEVMKISGNGFIDISTLQTGIYMLHADDKVVKFVKY